MLPRKLFSSSSVSGSNQRIIGWRIAPGVCETIFHDSQRISRKRYNCAVAIHTHRSYTCTRPRGTSCTNNNIDPCPVCRCDRPPPPPRPPRRLPSTRIRTERHSFRVPVGPPREEFSCWNGSWRAQTVITDKPWFLCADW